MVYKIGFIMALRITIDESKETKVIPKPIEDLAAQLQQACYALEILRLRNSGELAIIEHLKDIEPLITKIGTLAEEDLKILMGVHISDNNNLLVHLFTILNSSYVKHYDHPGSYHSYSKMSDEHLYHSAPYKNDCFHFYRPKSPYEVLYENAQNIQLRKLTINLIKACKWSVLRDCYLVINPRNAKIPLDPIPVVSKFIHLPLEILFAVLEKIPTEPNRTHFYDIEIHFLSFAGKILQMRNLSLPPILVEYIIDQFRKGNTELLNYFSSFKKEDQIKILTLKVNETHQHVFNMLLSMSRDRIYFFIKEQKNEFKEILLACISSPEALHEALMLANGKHELVECIIETVPPELITKMFELNKETVFQTILHSVLPDAHLLHFQRNLQGYFAPKTYDKFKNLLQYISLFTHDVQQKIFDANLRDCMRSKYYAFPNGFSDLLVLPLFQRIIFEGDFDRLFANLKFISNALAVAICKLLETQLTKPLPILDLTDEQLEYIAAYIAVAILRKKKHLPQLLEYFSKLSIKDQERLFANARNFIVPTFGGQESRGNLLYDVFSMGNVETINLFLSFFAKEVIIDNLLKPVVNGLNAFQEFTRFRNYNSFPNFIHSIPLEVWLSFLLGTVEGKTGLHLIMTFQNVQGWNTFMQKIRSYDLLSRTKICDALNKSCKILTHPNRNSVLGLALTCQHPRVIADLFNLIDRETIIFMINQPNVKDDILKRIVSYLMHEESWQTLSMIKIFFTHPAALNPSDPMISIAKELAERCLQWWRDGKKIPWMLSRFITNFLPDTSEVHMMRESCCEREEKRVVIITGKGSELGFDKLSPQKICEKVWEEGVSTILDYHKLVQAKLPLAIFQPIVNLYNGGLIFFGCHSTSYEEERKNEVDASVVDEIKASYARGEMAFRTIYSKPREIKDSDVRYDWDDYRKQTTDVTFRPSYLRNKKPLATHGYDFKTGEVKELVHKDGRDRKEKNKDYHAIGLSKNFAWTQAAINLSTVPFIGVQDPSARFVGVCLHQEYLVTKIMFSRDCNTVSKGFKDYQDPVHLYASRHEKWIFRNANLFFHEVQQNPTYHNEVQAYTNVHKLNADKSTPGKIRGAVQIFKDTPETRTLARKWQEDFRKDGIYLPIIFYSHNLREVSYYSVRQQKQDCEGVAKDFAAEQVRWHC